ncbi:MAG: serine acetyltransferase [Flavobacteriales bacterium]|nr:serine acetyltransferase [Flavobacteriales bacterium]MBP9079484.1 serine acetyltransferase [Flavobacteriales bacterium]
MTVRYGIFQDWRANRGNPKGRLVMACFRLLHLLRQSVFTVALFLPLFLLYRLLVEWVLCIELPWKTRIGPGFRLDHGQALVVNDGTVFGAGCTVRNSTTIGNKKSNDGSFSRAPIFGDRVDIGANAVIIGPITIGDDVAIGAGAVVVHDVPAGHVAVGNPARCMPRKPR